MIGIHATERVLHEFIIPPEVNASCLLVFQYALTETTRRRNTSLASDVDISGRANENTAIFAKNSSGDARNEDRAIDLLVSARTFSTVVSAFAARIASS